MLSPEPDAFSCDSCALAVQHGVKNDLAVRHHVAVRRFNLLALVLLTHHRYLALSAIR